MFCKDEETWLEIDCFVHTFRVEAVRYRFEMTRRLCVAAAFCDAFTERKLSSNDVSCYRIRYIVMPPDCHTET